MNKKIKILAALLSVVLLLAGCSTSAEMNALESKIEQLEIQNEKLNSEVSSLTKELEATPEPTLSPEPTPTPMSVPEDLEVTYIDVGQADSILIECGGESMLIDGGNVEDSDKIYSILQKKSISHLNYVIATHEHEDHVGGLAGALTYASADTILCPVDSAETEAFQNFKEKADENGGITVPDYGYELEVGKASGFVVGVNAGDGNDSSIIIRLEYGDTSFLFTGDAEMEAEKSAINAGHELKADVLKVGHHGSNTSSCYEFLREVMPKIAVISVGKDNSYGHPDADLMSRLRDVNSQVYRTDMQGDIVITSDGKEITVKTSKNQDAITNPEATPSPEPPPVIENNGENDYGEEQVVEEPAEYQYIGNANTGKFHRMSCSYLPDEQNRIYYYTRDEAINAGMVPCKKCNP